VNFALAHVVNAGDMDGDGYDDIAIGDPTANQSDGAVVIFKGGPKLDTVWDAAAGQSREGYFGYSLDKIGDINGDGFDDIIVGEYGYSWLSNNGAFSIYLGNKKIDAVKEKKAFNLPRIASLAQNYPNPFNPKTEIKFTVEKEAGVTVKIFDVLGQEISTLMNEKKSPGTYSIAWSPKNISAGIYFYQLNAITNEGTFFTDTKKMIYIP
jgi:hypothetical protein